MNRFIIAALTLTLLAGTQGEGRQEGTRLRTVYATASQSANRDGIWSHPRVMKCHSILKEHPRWKVNIEKFIRCAGEVWHAPGYPDYWVAIARCESGLYWRSYNLAGPYVGIYQHALSAWPYRVRTYVDVLGFRHTEWWRPEVNVIAAMRMAYRGGTWTTQWSCA